MKGKLAVLKVLILITMLSCGDGDSLKPTQQTVSPPPTTRTIYVNAKKENSTSELADIYYIVNSPSGSWTYLGSFSTTSCTLIGSFNANDGDIIQFAILENATSDGVWYRANTGGGGSCPNSGTAWCGNLVDGSDFSYQVSGDITIGLTGRVRTVLVNGQYVNQLWNCYF